MSRNNGHPRRIWILLGICLLVGLLVLAYTGWERPPELKAEQPEESVEAEIELETPEPTETPEPVPTGEAPVSERQDGVYTILLAGVDRLSGSTDVIVVGRMDTVRHEMNFVSIPRDTIINVDWDIRKLNSVYVGSLNYGGTGIDSLSNHIRWLTGFVPDCFAVIDLQTFIDVIDELGGVDFDVPEPVAYTYDDIRPGLYIELEPGYQHLNGEQAMALCRYRVGYTGGDLERIAVQQAFLKACFAQFAGVGTLPHAGAVLRLLSENLHTDLSAANIAWLLRQALLCDANDVHFYTMPADTALLQGYSYEIPRIWEWLELVNNCLNPYTDTVIGYGSVNVIYRDEYGAYHGTMGLDGAWYFEE